MEKVKKTKEYSIFKKRSGRYAVVNAKQAWIKGNEKVKILLKEKLIKLTAPTKKEEAPVAEAPSA